MKLSGLAFGGERVSLDDVGRLSARVNNFRNEDTQGNVKLNVTLEDIRETHVQIHYLLYL